MNFFKHYWIQVLSGITIVVLLTLLSKFKLKKNKPSIGHALKTMTAKEFIDFITPAAKNIEKNYGIPYKFIVAQIALETGYGKSELFYKYYNVGGIRSFRPQTEPNVMEWTHEEIPYEQLVNWPNRDKSRDIIKMKGGKKYVNIYVQLPFRKFNNITDGLNYYIKGVLTNKYFKPYIAEAGGDPHKYVDLLQSGKYGAKYATALNYSGTIKGIVNMIA